MKFGICAIVKNENLYLREWIEYHVKIGFDKIILYDNNDPEGEVPNVVIQDYIDKEIVTVYDIRKNEKTIKNQILTYNECLEKYKNSDIDYMAFLDIDEFVFIEKYNNIHQLYDNMPYYKYDAVLLSWMMFGDNGHLYYENKPVQERFTKSGDFKYNINLDLNASQMIKSIVKLKSNANFIPGNPHVPVNNACNSWGVECSVNNYCTNLSYPNYGVIYIKHYYTKSLTEFLYRRQTNFSFYNKHLSSINSYKTLCGWTEKHEKIYQEFLKNIEQ